MPVYNDWHAVRLLLPRLNDALAAAGLTAAVLVVDDGSTSVPPSDFSTNSCHAVISVQILTLRRNVGHQRAICLGLSYLADGHNEHPVVVMDCDGEDDPVDIPALYEEYLARDSAAVVFASRAKRSESYGFRAFYQIYKRLFTVLTGQKMHFGNFSVVPPALVRRLSAVSELWNHYAAAVVKSRLPRTSVATARAVRLTGKSRMNFVSLVLHGFSAISVFSDVVAVRLMCACLMLAIFFACGLVTVISVRLLTTLAIPGWATSAGGLLALLFLQAVMMSLVFVFVILSDRSANHFLPIRDYRYFVLDTRTLSAMTSAPGAMHQPMSGIEHAEQP